MRWLQRGKMPLLKKNKERWPEYDNKITMSWDSSSSELRNAEDLFNVIILRSTLTQIVETVGKLWVKCICLKNIHFH